MNRHSSCVCAILLTMVVTDGAAAQPSTGPTTPTTQPAAATQPAGKEQAALEAWLQETLTGAELVGRWAPFDRPDAAPKEDRYLIESARKIPLTDRWLLTARVHYGQKDVLVPLTIPVKWAGDTPVISVTDMTIPKLGTYTARVMVYRDQYAGTWSGKNHGGHMWGRIERAPTTEATTQPAP